jgi:arylsulfatase A-like enzyme
MVFVVSDNGTPSAAVEYLLHDPNHAKSQPYELGVRVPMLVAGPMIPRGAHESEALVHAVDLWRTRAELSGAQESLAAPLQPVDSLSFANVLRDPGAPSARTEIFTQLFVQPGSYVPTDGGPYEPACSDPQLPGVYFWLPKNVGGHVRSLSDGHHKLIVWQATAAIEVAPPGTPDVPPTYVEEFYDLWADPEETTDLVPSLPGDAGLAAIRDQLRARLTQLSGL